ncbi:hypothetical protein LZZ85_04595 [Terrimonas sp. NA20]|uniref:Response regulatory domain-containing protein n=1 Tax=Terrimonas ginsenosidimutans TaxID=2908004 RepID=A0ABS9KMJ0_9BACT|nr:hypothetical protein [Terrimonas ginsenosidimutans]MCG2613543.1 hypothetical protein [Terrimonas ginsenosidimutans]
MYQPPIQPNAGFQANDYYNLHSSTAVRLALITDEQQTVQQMRQILAGSLQSRKYTFDHYADFSSATTAHSSTGKMIVFARIAMPGFFDFLKKVDHSGVRIIALIDDIADELLAARLLELEYVLKPSIQPEAILRSLRLS